MRGRFRLAEAARQLDPMQQGDLDGLCGFYAIMNAVRLRLHPLELRRPELFKLAAPGLKALSKTRQLHVIIYDGIVDRRWRKMAAAIVGEANHRHHDNLTVVDLLVGVGAGSTRAAIKAVARALGRGEPVVLLLTRRYDHWTVAVGYTKQRVFLFDSSGYRWINWSSVALERSGLPALHGLARAYAIRRA